MSIRSLVPPQSRLARHPAAMIPSRPVLAENGTPNTNQPPMKIVVAYSGGLDTSVLLLWLKENYNAEIIAYCADVGQGDELDGLEAKGPHHRRLEVLHRRPQGGLRRATSSSR